MSTTNIFHARAGFKRLLASRFVDALAAPHGIERYMELIDPLWAIDAVRARIVAVREQTPDCVTLTLRPNDNWHGFRAGQYVQFGVEIDGVRCTRCFSLAGSPRRTDGLIEITVKAHDDGFVSRHLVDHAAAGDVVTLSQAMGQFVLPADSNQPLLLIGGGSGITPLMSMLRSLIDAGSDLRNVTFLHYARDYAQAVYRAELMAIAVAYPAFRPVWAVTRGTPRNGDLAGHFRAGHLHAAAPDYRRMAAYVCGPAALIEAAQRHWQAHASQASLQVEYFKAAPVAAAADAGAASGELRFATSERVVDNNGRTLLEQAEAAGLNPAYGCRMGICQSCTCRKRAGTVRNVHTGELCSDTDTEIQLCVNAPVGDVTLDL